LSKVILEGYVIAPDSDLAAIEEELPNHLLLTRQEEGCIKFEVTQDHKNPNRFNVYEEFTSEKAFDTHRQRLRGTRWSEVSSNLEKHYKTRSNNA